MSSVANVYMGTSEFAVEVLGVLARSAHRPLLVVTPPDRPKGRGRKLSSPPVADLARELGIDTHQTASVNEPGSAALLRACGAELGIVCAFGQLIKEPLLSELPMLNVHPSLLPRWRGAAPIERAMMAGDESTGVAVMRLTEGLDSGPVALTEVVAIGAGESYGDLATRLARCGGELLVRALDLHAKDALEWAEQPEQGVTYAEKIGPADRRLDPTRSATEVADAVRALTPHIGAQLELEGGGRLGVRAAEAVAGTDLAPGSVSVDELGRLIVGCSPGALVVSELQPPGKRPMPSADWWRGHPAPQRIPLS
ncbi:MAG: methionyl-tRNA formyltransferase [Solirubrobacterales bacterium]